MKTSINLPNRLIYETSPYLQQHAHNPVNWYPWGEDAFQRAKTEDKPIFLSIGYSTCHWCHVMAHESFEDEQVAEVLNRDYISIKVDKEERPDIDAVYMAVCQGLTGSGGWPLTILMSPDQKPFFAGTYFPKARRYNMPGILELLETVTREWQNRRDSLLETADKIISVLNDRQEKTKPHTLRKASEKDGEVDATQKWATKRHLMAAARDTLCQSFDVRHGGFGRSPKFPMPHNLMFLLRWHHFEKDSQALAIVEKTLRQMYRGGIFDHIGYGFSRYSTDDKWLAPHFEKMLYDNALLAMAFLEAYQVTGTEFYGTAARKILQYILREMTDENSGFYSAQDADSEGTEGKYYLFSKAELMRLLGTEEGAAFCDFFDVTEKGNFEGSSILNLIQTEEYEQIPSAIEKRIPEIYEYRRARTALHKDDKLLTAWNALMIAAFAKAYKALEDVNYLRAAEKAAAFLTENMTEDDGRLKVSFRGGKASGTGTLDDYAFFSWALLELYEATLTPAYLEQARTLCDIMLDGFADHEVGGFFLTDREAEALIYRPKETFDGAIPSGNSIAGYVLIKLWRLTGLDEYHRLGQRQLQFLSERAASYPAGHCFAMMALMMEFYPGGFLCENGVCS